MDDGGIARGEGASLPAARPSGAWLAVLLLAAMYCMSLLDRTVLSVIAAPVSDALGVSDSQMGLLMGTGFALLYCLAGLPLAHWIDASERRRLVVLGVTLWSTMTILSAFATNYTTLLFARSGLALGEAVLTPAAVSLIADFFVKEKRALPMTVYTSVATIMSTGSFAGCGLALTAAQAMEPAIGMAPWRLTLILLGIPGLLLAALFLLLIKEPPRSDTGPRAGAIPFKVFLAYLRQHWWFYVPLLLGGAAIGLFSLSMLSWLPTIMKRELGISPAYGGYWIGLIVTPTNLVALYSWPWLAARIDRKHLSRGMPICLLLSSLGAVLFFTFGPLMRDPMLFILGVALSMTTVAAWTVLPPIGFQIFCPNRMRGRMSAMYLLVVSAVGYGVGPVLTVALGHLWGTAGEGKSLSLGLATSGALASLVMVVCAAICVKTAPRLQRVA